MPTKIIELKSFEESPQVYDRLEERLKKFFKAHFYYPLLKEMDLSRRIVQNASHPNPLMDALFTGRIHYENGVFSGELSAGISKELKALGATFDRKTGTYQLEESQIPTQIKQVISAGHIQLQKKLQKIDDHLSKIIPEDLAKEFKCEDIFDQTLWKADKDFKKNVKNITVVPELTDSQRKRIADEWQNNMQLYIKDWTEEQIKTLRKNIFEDVMSGKRREAHIPPILKITKTIQGSHDEAVNKAQFLAHQESRLLLAKFKEVRYTDAGIHEYIWRCVHRPHDPTPNQHSPGNVRYSHGLLNGKIFRWDDPPISTNPGEPVRRNNPGQDYRCRCFARPILRTNK